jgi:hypothetical protein
MIFDIGGLSKMSGKRQRGSLKPNANMNWFVLSLSWTFHPFLSIPSQLSVTGSL